MAAAQLMLPANRAFDSNGFPSVGCVVRLYESGTSTPANFYADANLSISLGTTLVTNAAGRLVTTAYQNTGTPFRIVIEAANGDELDDIDPYYFGSTYSTLTSSSSSVVATRSDMATIAGTDGAVLFLTETGREGEFIFSTDDLSTEVTADTAQGIYVPPTTDTTGANGAWVRVDKAIKPSYFGAAGDGVTDDRAAFAALDALLPEGQPLLLFPGSYLIAADLTLSRPVAFLGGVLSVPNGVTVTIEGSISAPLERIFTLAGSGAVALSGQGSGHPEWWGAVTGDPAVDCRPAILACATAVHTTLFAPADYYITDTLKLPFSNKQFLGVGGTGVEDGLGIDSATGLGTAGGTRIILTGANVVDATVLVIGKDAGTVDDASISRNLIVRDIKAARDCSTVSVRPSLTADPIDCVKGVTVSYISSSLIERVKSFDSPVGFYCFGVVNTVLRDCNVQRKTPASAAANDFFVGYLSGGYDGPNYGYIGANASIYFDHCTVFDQDNAFDRSVGMRLFGFTPDTFVTQFEMARLDFGIEIDGRDAAGVTITNAAGSGAQQDISIVDAVLDGCLDTALTIHDTNDSLSVDIGNIYAAATSIGISITDAAGSVNIAGGRIVSAGAKGIYAQNINGLRIGPVHIRNTPLGIDLDTVGMARVGAHVFAFVQAMATALNCTGVFRSILEPQVSGAPGFVTDAIKLDATSSFCKVDGSAVEPGALAGGVAHKVRFNDQDARAGQAGATAFTAAGNVLTGIDQTESGTCTLVLTDNAGTAATMGPDNSFRYTRNGDLVTVSGTLNWTSTAALAAGSRLRITGLPYPLNSQTNYRAPAIVGPSAAGSFTITRPEIAFGADGGNDFFYGSKVSLNNQDGNLTKADIGTAGTIYGFQITYHA